MLQGELKTLRRRRAAHTEVKGMLLLFLGAPRRTCHAGSQPKRLPAAAQSSPCLEEPELVLGILGIVW